MKKTLLPYPIPFHTQRVTPETFAAEGYRSWDEGAFWASRSCGIASLRMVLDGLLAKAGRESCPRQGELVRQGTAVGAYRSGVGWIHQGLVELAASYGVSSRRFDHADRETLGTFIREEHPCILSVSPRFAGGERRKDGSVVSKGGHLVVLLGIEEAADGAVTALYCHHPSCFEDANWPSCRIDAQRFDASWTGRGIVFDPIDEDNQTSGGI